MEILCLPIQKWMIKIQILFKKDNHIILMNKKLTTINLDKILKLIIEKRNTKKILVFKIRINKTTIYQITLVIYLVLFNQVYQIQLNYKEIKKYESQVWKKIKHYHKEFIKISKKHKVKSFKRKVFKKIKF